MIRLLLSICVLSLCIVPAAAGETEPVAGNLAEALADGSFEVGLRYRYESVSDDGISMDGSASTLRTTFGYSSAPLNGFGFSVMFEDVTDIGRGDDHANAGAGSLNNGVMGRPTIADPELTDVLRANLWWKSAQGTRVTAGRDEINLGQQRFVGAVGWRQHHQSFDALQIETSAIKRTELNYAYLNRQNRIFGDNRSMGSHALFADVNADAGGTFTIYALRLDYDDVAFSGVSTDTYGVRWSKKFDAGEGWKLPVHLEFAQQKDAGDNPNDVDADYYRIEIGGACDVGWVRVGVESLGGSASDGAFTTPLATLHKWNGWADRFLSTPANGLEDRFLGVGMKRGAWSAAAFYHDFASDTMSMDYGTEIDAVVTWKAPWKQRFSLKMARYSADQFSTDVDKYWLETAYKF